LIAKVLGIEPFRAAEPPPARKTYGQAQGLWCPNARCITQHATERRHLTPKFWLIRSTRLYARCCYCETDTELACYVDLSTRRVSRDFDRIDQLPASDVLLFASEKDAQAALAGKS
jgi:hypothetical protein